MNTVIVAVLDAARQSIAIGMGEDNDNFSDTINQPGQKHITYS